eukprot:31057-Pelagococcus_subviridis.AAC.10
MTYSVFRSELPRNSTLTGCREIFLTSPSNGEPSYTSLVASKFPVNVYSELFACSHSTWHALFELIAARIAFPPSTTLPIPSTPPHAVVQVGREEDEVARERLVSHDPDEVAASHLAPLALRHGRPVEPFRERRVLLLVLLMPFIIFHRLFRHGEPDD